MTEFTFCCVAIKASTGDFCDRMSSTKSIEDWVNQGSKEHASVLEGNRPAKPRFPALCKEWVEEVGSRHKFAAVMASRMDTGETAEEDSL